MLLLLSCSGLLQWRVKAVIFYFQTWLHSVLYFSHLLDENLWDPSYALRSSGRRYVHKYSTLQWQSPAETDQKSDDLTFIPWLRCWYLCSLGRHQPEGNFQRPGVLQVLHSLEVKAQHCWELHLWPAYVLFLAHNADNLKKQSSKLERCRINSYPGTY